MKNKPLTLSIVIPVYNEQGYLRACLDAIAAQSVLPDEVIVVNNNSTDKTAEVAKAYKFVQLIDEDHQGIVYARNTGFNAARSDLIGRIDGDTILPPNWVAEIKHLYKTVGQPGNYAVTCPSIFRNRGWNVLWQSLHRLTYFWPSRLLMGHTTLVGSNMFLTRKLWLDIRGKTCTRSDIHEDMDLAWHAYRAGAKIDFKKSFKASIVSRKMLSRVIIYPKMMIKMRLIDHNLVITPK